jgi:NAD(P)H-flavin reductase
MFMESDEMIPKVFFLDEMKRETSDTVTLNLSPKNIEDYCKPKPGQFNMVYLHGKGEIPLSFSQIDNEKPVYTHSIRDVGAVSKGISGLQKGDFVGVRGPFGTAWPLDKENELIIVAGGIGIAPLCPLIDQALAKKTQKITVLYGARHTDELLFLDQIKEWQEKGARVITTVDHAETGWKGHIGVVTSLLDLIEIDVKKTTVMICGPDVMMRYTTDKVLKLGVKETAIYLSIERNMKCAIGFCGHCQFGAHFVCKDGPIFNYSKIKDLMWIQEI